MSYAIEASACSVSTAAQLLKALNSKRGGTVYLAPGIYDLTAETRINIRTSLIAPARASIFLPDDDLGEPILRTSIYPFEGMTFEGIYLTNPLSFPVVCDPANDSTQKQIYIRRCCFYNIGLTNLDFDLFQFTEADVNVDMCDTTILNSFGAKADLLKLRRSQFVVSDGVLPLLDPTEVMSLFASVFPAGADRSLYMSSTDFHYFDQTTAVIDRIPGLSIGPFATAPTPYPVLNRAELFDTTTVGVQNNGVGEIINSFLTKESVYLINHTFVCGRGNEADPQLVRARTDGTDNVGTDVFLDSYGYIASNDSSAGAIVEAEADSSLTLGVNQFIVGDAVGVSINDYDLGVIP